MQIKDLPDGQIEEACALFHKVFAVQATPEAWRWKYHGTALLGSINLVAFDASEALVGHAGALVLPGMDAGAPRAMIQVCDVMVAAHRRGKGGAEAVYPALMRALREAIAMRFPGAYAYGFPGKRPFLLGERVGFYRRSYDITQVECEVLDARNAIWPWERVQVLDWGGERAAMLERLWVQHGAHAASPAVVRDAAYLQWRYAQHPTRRYTLLMFYQGWRVAGWWVVSVEGGRLRIVDALGRDLFSLSALRRLSAWAKAQGLAHVLSWKPVSSLAGRVTDTGIVAMQFVLSAPGDPAESLRAPGFMPGDLDIF